MRKLLPESVFSTIQTHLRDSCARGEKGWESGKDEEDTLTGDLCGSLRTDGWIELTERNETSWKFRVTYKKFRGRGKGAAEKSFGADGIIELQIEDDIGSKTGKGLLFQAKKRTDRGRKKLEEQVECMEGIVAGGSAVFVYGPDNYTGVDSKDFFNERDMTLSSRRSSRLGDYLADRFLPCDSGKRGMFYDAVSHAIVCPDGNGNIVRYKATVEHRLRIEVVGE